MTCNISTASVSTSIQACLNASSLQQKSCGNSFPALGQGVGRKAFLSKEIDHESSFKPIGPV